MKEERKIRGRRGRKKKKEEGNMNVEKRGRI